MLTRQESVEFLTLVCCRLLLLRCYMKSVWNHRVLCVVFWEQVDVQLTSSVLQVEALRFYMRSVCNNWTLCVVFRLQDDVQLTSECKEGKSESNADKGVWSSAKAGRMIRCMKWSFCKLCQSLDFCVLTIVKNCNSATGDMGVSVVWLLLCRDR